MVQLLRTPGFAYSAHWLYEQRQHVSPTPHLATSISEISKIWLYTAPQKNLVHQNLENGAEALRLLETFTANIIYKVF